MLSFDEFFLSLLFRGLYQKLVKNNSWNNNVKSNLSKFEFRVFNFLVKSCGATFTVIFGFAWTYPDCSGKYIIINFPLPQKYANESTCSLEQVNDGMILKLTNRPAIALFGNDSTIFHHHVHTSIFIVKKDWIKWFATFSRIIKIKYVAHTYVSDWY